MKPRPSKQTGKIKGQATLEIALSIAGVVLLLVGSLAIFIWVNQGLVLRQEAYENSRDNATESDTEVQVDESKILPALNIFK